MGKGSSSKRSFSPAARRQQLDGSGRPRRVLWSYCPHHKGGYYFYDVRVHNWNINEANRWETEPDMKKVRGLCMACTHTSVFFVGTDELEEHHYTNIELCLCGLPAYHKEPSPEFCTRYNAHPVPCRANTNFDQIALLKFAIAYHQKSLTDLKQKLRYLANGRYSTV